MLARVADALYWIGRYLERAENITRLLLATEDLTTEIRGFNEKLAEAEWADLLAIFPGARVDVRPGRRPDAGALDHLAAFFAGPENAYSVAFSLRKARENARAVREALSVEVFVHLNQVYRGLESEAAAAFADLPAARAALSATHSGLFTVAGAIDATLSRDEGWAFLELGESLERVYRTAIILRAKLPGLLAPAPATELYYSQWRSLLRSLASLEPYRRLHGARMEPADIVGFLLLDPHAPRSLRFGASAVARSFERLASGRALSPPARIVGKLHAELSYADPAALAGADALLPFLDGVLGELAKVHDALEPLYFAA
jgi:uncharacterized alpha-E superfamily protein